MAEFIKIQKSLHQSAGYSPVKGMSFAEKDISVPVLIEEIAQVAASMVIAFQKNSKSNLIELVALQSVKPGENAFVLPNGRWLGGYVPSFYRGYPFALIAGEKQGELVLSIDETVLVDEPAEDDQRLFDGEEISSSLKERSDFLIECLKNRQATLKMCLQLNKLGLITDWPIYYTDPSVDAEKKQLLSGFYRIDPIKLSGLSGEELASLNATGALRLAFAQQLSTTKLDKLIGLTMAKQQFLANQKVEEPDLERLFGSDDEVLSF